MDASDLSDSSFLIPIALVLIAGSLATLFLSPQPAQPEPTTDTPTKPQIHPTDLPLPPPSPLLLPPPLLPLPVSAPPPLSRKHVSYSSPPSPVPSPTERRRKFSYPKEQYPLKDCHGLAKGGVYVMPRDRSGSSGSGSGKGKGKGKGKGRQGRLGSAFDVAGYLDHIAPGLTGLGDGDVELVKVRRSMREGKGTKAVRFDELEW
ncbi:uncharacterized protein KY384_003489 [Bacidia gigantensis]|uniref:uncharacterized protein n=1 Tax=Bacidia gigantensis TaxID=2732470 RepID=UPI001D054D21|nr:uncharacterized protein KY384_003489 [Bacidia gigantensis]KAG8531853.1 hypothetical protein KY384_003489 [Bacidia gigantensis]